MRTAPPLLLALAAAGCAETSTTYEETLPAEGVWDVFCDIERGDFAYAGTAAAETFDLQVLSWGEGSTVGRAGARADNNEWGAQVTGSLLDVWGRSPTRKAGTDIAVEGPQVIDVEAVLLDGTAVLQDVDGFHLVTANRVVGERILGDVDFYASLDGIDAEVYPYDGSVLRLEAYGDVVLRVPYGLEYDLEVFVDPGWGAEVMDLGFDTLYLGPDYISAQTGSGSIQIDVFLAGGTFYLWEAPPLQ